jgi:hypothetical protein
MTELVGHCAHGAWMPLVEKTHSPQSFDAPQTRPRPTNGRGASGAGSCGTQRSTSRIPSRLCSSFAGEAVSTNASRVTVGGSGGVPKRGCFCELVKKDAFLNKLANTSLPCLEGIVESRLIDGLILNTKKQVVRG